MPSVNLNQFLTPFSTRIIPCISLNSCIHFPPQTQLSKTSANFPPKFFPLLLLFCSSSVETVNKKKHYGHLGVNQ